GSRLDLDDADRDAVEAGCLGDRAYHEVLRVYELSDGHRLVRVVEAGELELHGLEDLLELLPLENDEVARSLEILGDDLGDGVAEIGIADRGVDIVEVGDRDGASLRRLGGELGDEGLCEAVHLGREGADLRPCRASGEDEAEEKRGERSFGSRRRSARAGNAIFDHSRYLTCYSLLKQASMIGARLGIEKPSASTASRSAERSQSMKGSS